MNKVMWAVYNSRNSKSPRALFENRADADSYHYNMSWGITVRVELDIRENEKTIIVRHHEYRHIERKKIHEKN